MSPGRPGSRLAWEGHVYVRHGFWIYPPVLDETRKDGLAARDRCQSSHACVQQLYHLVLNALLKSQLATLP
jgi:hypothetical protein